MKQLITIIFLTIFTMLSCSSDDGNIQSSDNKITVNNESFDTPIFAFEKSYQDNGYYVEIMSDLYFDGGEGFYSGFTYYYDGEHIFNYSTSENEGTFSGFDYLVENNPFTSNNFEEINGEIIDGTIIIEKNDNIFTINIDCINQEGQTVITYHLIIFYCSFMYLFALMRESFLI